MELVTHMIYNTVSTRTWRFDLWEVPVEVSPVRFLEAGAEAKVWQLHMTSCIKQQVVGLYVPEINLCFMNEYSSLWMESWILPVFKINSSFVDEVYITYEWL